MKLLITTIFCSFITINTFSQTITSDNLKQLDRLDKYLKIQSDSIINAEEWVTRFVASKDLITGLVTALKINNSFYYPFDSVLISKMYAPDSSFRIFTWQVMKDFDDYRQFGAIQMKTADGSLKLFPLFDASDFTYRPTDSVRSADKWIGAIYYKIILKTYNNKKYYTLLGSDESNAQTNKKWIDILWFDDNGNPQFGYNGFTYPANDYSKPPQPCYRFCVEYKKNGGVRVRYDEKLDEIIFDHIISENNEVSNKATYIPYGDYEGFRWKDGKWVHNTTPFDALPIETNKSEILKPLFDDDKKSKNIRRQKN